MRILPKAKYPELSEKIKSIQKSYPLKCHELRAAFEKLEHWVDDNSVSFRPEELIDGHAYGLLDMSLYAFAYDNNTRSWLRNHGDIYCYLWRWNSETNRFWCETAWNSFDEKQLATIHRPLIEY